MAASFCNGTRSMRQTTYQITFVLFVSLVFAIKVNAQAPPSLDLTGPWQFSLDRGNKGIEQRWFDRSLTERITLPGALQAQGFGDEISTTTPWVLSLYDRNWFLREDYKAYTKAGSIKVPFLSQPPRHFLGPAWYNREVDIPANWKDKRIVLFLERPHWESTVWIDGQNRFKLASAPLRVMSDPENHSPRSTAPIRRRMYRSRYHSVSDSLAEVNGIARWSQMTSPAGSMTLYAYPNVEKRSQQ